MAPGQVLDADGNPLPNGETYDQRLWTNRLSKNRAQKRDLKRKTRTEIDAETPEEAALFAKRAKIAESRFFTMDELKEDAAAVRRVISGTPNHLTPLASSAAKIAFGASSSSNTLPTASKSSGVNPVRFRHMGQLHDMAHFSDNGLWHYIVWIPNVDGMKISVKNPPDSKSLEAIYTTMPKPIKFFEGKKRGYYPVFRQSGRARV
ncbi:UNVERIFIED_CONTAM: hypothetical protein HDU68_003802 [Siphonaria sp. JEL0065]|nr:hypothetical protein HDU68_003802 [Siphonaria sp. JEL0065]